MTAAEQEIFYKMLGNRIREARVAAGLKQEAFASLLGLSRVSIVNIEKGRQGPPLHLLWDVARVLNLDVLSLLPDFVSAEKVTATWEKIITKQSKGDEKTKGRLIGFLEEIKSEKNS